jgi:putative ABC transport system permease protein
MTFLRDLRFGLRILRRNPSYGCAAIAVMALGVGATTAVFSVLRGILITPLPYREPNRLVLFRADLPGFVHRAALTSDEYHALAGRSDLFEQVAVIDESSGNLTTPDDMTALNAAAVSENFFETLGVRPLLGRFVARGDSGKLWSVDIAFELWQKHFGGDPKIIGRAIEVDNRKMIVAGVLPRGFLAYLGSGVNIPPRVDIWYARSRGYDDDPFRGQVVIGRLRRGVALEAARAPVDALARNLVARQPSSYRTGDVRLSLSPLDDEIVSEVKPALMAVAGAVAFVLIVACANLTNLLLARASARVRELALRMSIGASRAQIVRQLVAEGLVVGVAGACGGWLLAQWGVDALLLLAPAALPRREAIAIDGRVALFAVAVSLACAVVVSVVPAWHATKTDVSGRLKQDPSATRAAGVTRGVLIASQLALSLMLLVGAGLMMRAFVGLRSVALGFEPRGAAAMFISLEGRRFGAGTLDEARATRLAYYEQLTASVRDIPGVQAAGVGFPVPLGNISMSQRFSIGPGEPEHAGEGFIAFAGYLDALRVRLIAGRLFTREDDRQPVVVVDDRLAGEVWPRDSALGRRLLIVPSVGQPKWTTVVGVVGHVQTQGLRASGLPQIWMTYATRSYAQLDMVVRATDPMAATVPAVDTVQRLGAGRPVRDIRLLDDYVADASSDTRFALFVLGVLAALAVVLTGVGVYGVVAYSTARRTREIAVRLALGADAGRIIGLVVRESAIWTVGGLAAGVVGARLLTRYVETLLFRVGPTDGLTFLSVAALLSVVALIATAAPALRALRTDPMQALRAE